LGIDSIKKAQLFGELQEYFDIRALAAGGGAGGSLSLDDFTTLRHVLDFLLKASVGSPAAATAPVAETTAPPAASIASAEAVPGSAAAVALAGTPYDLGWQHGQHFKAEIRQILRTYADCVGGELGELPGQASAIAPERLLSADELDELQGVADAVEVPLGNLIAHQLALLAEAGTGAGQFAVVTGAADAKRWTHALQQPAPLVGALRAAARAAVFARSPIGEIPHLALSYVGCVGILGGLNSAGVAITAYPSGNSSLKSASLAAGQSFRAVGGVAASTLVRTVLGSATNLEQAVEIARSLAVAGGQPWKALITEAMAAEAIEVEFDGRELSVHSAPAGHALGKIGLPAESHVDAGALAAQLAASTPADPTAATASRRLQPAAGADNIALVLEPELGAAWLGDSATDGNVSLPNSAACWTTKGCLPAWDGTASTPAVLAAGSESPPFPLPANPITSRFSLEMREAPLPSGTAATPVWTGEAIILGGGATADALKRRLEQSGATVRVLNVQADAEAVLAALEEICNRGPAPHLFITTTRDAGPIDPYHIDAWEEQHYATMQLPFLVCQKWTQLAAAGGWLDRATLVATTAEGGDFGFDRGAVAPQGGSLAGLLKAIFVEFAIMADMKNLRVKVIDAPQDVPADALAANVLRELASGNVAYEVAYVGSRRLIPYAVERRTENLVAGSTRPGTAIRPGSTWVATGGARGITAVTALELGRRYGVKLHLIGSTPLAEVDPAWRELDHEGLQKLKASVMIAARKAGKPTAQAWQRVEKDLEIDRTLRSFAAAGVSVTYHACDVSNREALAETLERIHQADGPIAGILHGAGIERSCRFEKKQREVVSQTIRTKVDGTAHLIALTRRDPIRHFMLFGSISGRLGGYGQADYSLANEMACKLLGSYRRARPWVQAVGIHWHPWDEVGMAARPETKSILEAKGAMAMMPLAEGLAHIVREMAAGTPEPEVMITERHHWERFAAGLGTLATEVRGTAPDDTAAALPLLTDLADDGTGVAGQATFDPTADRFLIEHRLRGKPLLPVVVGLETLVEAARTAAGRPIAAFRDIDMIDGLMFHADRPIVARARATRLADGTLDCRLTADFFNRNGGLIQPDRLYLTAKAVPADVPLEPLAPLPATIGQWHEFQYPNEAPIYHGPVFRGVKAACANPERGTAQILALPLKELVGEARVAGWTIPSCVLDAAMYSCAMHLWAFGDNAIALPRRIGDLRLGRLPRDGEMCLAHFVLIDPATGEFDFDVMGEDGTPIVQARRYGQVVFARGVSA
ncbi:MAG TPA: SDR family NAD(P)-dependent oxidoreductase, partial [Pirellulales bacterium]|nr:SDR family NAD(P)-dependent oxidoreductase [Pirellulales bacterium]